MKKNNKLFVIIIAGLAAHLLLLVNFKFTAWPEMLLWPYMLINGLLPYRDIAIAHTPLLVIELGTIFKLFGVGLLQLKIFTWLTILLVDLLVFIISNKIWKQKVATIAFLSYILVQLFYDGNGLWFDLALTPIALTVFYLTTRKKYFLAGAAWALMFLTKQTAIWFIVPIFIQNFKTLNFKMVKHFAYGSLLVLIIFTLIFKVVGLLPDFYNWSIYFGTFVLPRAAGQIQLPDLKNFIVSMFPFVIFLPLIISKNKTTLSLAAWSIAGIMGAYPRFEYFHFQPGVPFLALGIGLAMAKIDNKNRLLKTFIPLYLVGMVYLFFSFFIRNYGEGVRFYEPGVAEVVNFVKESTIPGDKVFVLNWWDNIYPLSNTVPATDPWVPQLSWYQEMPGIQDKEVGDLAKNKPKLIIFQRYSDTGLSSYVPKKLYEFIQQNYKFSQKVDGVDILIPI